MNLRTSLLTAVLLALPATEAADWPDWRGPSGNQVSPETRFPLTWSWSKDGGKNIRWRTPLPEPGNSSPIVTKGHVYVTQALDDGKRRALIAFGREDGQELWRHVEGREAADPRHETNPHCAASPTADADGVVASFAAAGVVSVSHGGKLQWKADLGPQDHSWGHGPSPVILGDRVLVYHGPGSRSALYALDRKSGKTLWKTDLQEVQPAERFDGFAGRSGGMIGTFGTPLVVATKERTEVVLPVSNRLRAFSPADGRELWSIDGMNPLVYTSASFGEDTVVAMGGFFGSTIVARPGGSGDRTAERLSYERRAKKHRIGSPIVRDGRAYLASTDGFAQCVDLKTGTMVWEERLPATGSNGETWASMTLAGDRLHVVNRSGDTLVLRAGPKFELLASNPVGELSNSTLAMSDGRIFLRTHAALYCIAEPATASAR